MPEWSENHQQLVERIARAKLARSAESTEEEKQVATNRLAKEVERLGAIGVDDLVAEGESMFGEFFYLGKTYHPAEYSFWARAAQWSLFEGACLLSGEDPRRTELSSLNSVRGISARVRRVLEVFDLAKRAGERRQLNKDNTPLEFLNWAKDLDYRVPAKLENMVRDRYGNLETLRSERTGMLEERLSTDSKVEKQKRLHSEHLLYLENKAVQAIGAFPAWKESQRRVQRTGNLQDWLKNEFQLSNRDADTVKKVLSENFDF